ncbi:hypothetical protein JCM10207_000829 [Rhodosporidiobolus poonsookiae]
MVSSLITLGAAVGAASTVAAQGFWPTHLKDPNVGVHIPGAIPLNPVEPLQHRLAYAGSDGMTVSWSTFAKLEQPQVRYGFRPDKLEFVANSTRSTTYPTSRTYNNAVKLTGLKPNTKYYYSVSYSNIGSSAYLPTYSFKTAHAPGDDEPYTVAVFADLGLMGEDGLSTRYGPYGGIEHAILEANETNTIQSMMAYQDSFDFMIHVGDIGYADYFLRESVQGYFGTDDLETMPTQGEVAEKYESMNEQFFDQMRPLAAQKPWMVSPGNHEANCDNGGYTDKRANITYTDAYCLEGQTNFTFYNEKFNMPSEESNGVENMWYSYDNGLVHYVSLNCETDLGEGLMGPIENVTNNHNGPFGKVNQQVDWLKNDLANVDRSKTPWVIALFHRPWYTNVNDVLSQYPAWQQAFEKVLYDNEVDVYFNGHVHTYERFWPSYNNTIEPTLNNPRAPMPVVLGHAGHYDGLDEFDADHVMFNNTAFATDQEYGWTRLTIHNATHLTLESLAARNGSIIDEATLYKEHNFKNKRAVDPRCGKFKC